MKAPPAMRARDDGGDLPLLTFEFTYVIIQSRFVRLIVFAFFRPFPAVMFPGLCS